MGLFRKPNLDRAPASVEVRFGPGTASANWHGEAGLLVRSPHIYLDWAVNKDRRSSALEFLDEVATFLEANAGSDAWRVPTEWSHIDVVPDPADAEIAIAYTPKMRCSTAFRPRTAIARYLYPTFWVLWNELATRIQADEPEAMLPLVYDLATQLEYYDEHGVGSRGGVAPVYAARVGAGERLGEEIAAFAGMTVEEFRALPEAERDEIYARHTAASIEQEFGERAW
jgi:hypothetical protein